MQKARGRRDNAPTRRQRWQLVCIFSLVCFCGCYAPLHSPGVRACALPDDFRMPIRATGPLLNYACLTTTPPTEYALGPGDALEIIVPNLFPGGEVRPFRVEVMSGGGVLLPLVGPVRVGGMNLLLAQEVISNAYSQRLVTPVTVNVTLAAKKTVDVLVLGEVKAPGIYPLPKYQNDVGHALAAAGGFNEFAADTIEVHRRRYRPGDSPAATENANGPNITPVSFSGEEFDPISGQWLSATRIPLRGSGAHMIPPAQIILEPGDVVRVPSRSNEVFYVVGKLSPNNLVQFTLGDRERELGAGLVLPRDREIDVVTAVAMAGYIDPIDSPTTVTVHRVMPDGKPLLILVDLIKARYSPQETVLVRPGDIIYLNPDAAWWCRRTFDRVVGEVILVPYRKLFNP